MLFYTVFLFYRVNNGFHSSTGVTAWWCYNAVWLNLRGSPCRSLGVLHLCGQNCESESKFLPLPIKGQCWCLFTTKVSSLWLGNTPTEKLEKWSDTRYVGVDVWGLTFYIYIHTSWVCVWTVMPYLICTQSLHELFQHVHSEAPPYYSRMSIHSSSGCSTPLSLVIITDVRIHISILAWISFHTDS